MNVVKEKKKIWDLTKPARPNDLEDSHEHFLRKSAAYLPILKPGISNTAQLQNAQKDLKHSEKVPYSKDYHLE